MPDHGIAISIVEEEGSPNCTTIGSTAAVDTVHGPLSLVSSGTSSCSAGSSRNLPDWNLIFIRKLQFQLLRLSSIKVIVQLGFLGPVIAYRHHREGLWTAHLLAKAERNGEEQLPFWWTRCNHILPII